jgi:hypothetical protein
MRLRGGLTIGVCTVACAAGCGATPPQAPPREAHTLGGTTSTISSVCGVAYQIHAFGQHDRRSELALEAAAEKAAQRLLSVYKTNRDWIFQGETVSAIVNESISALRECSLPRAAHALSAAIRSH